MGYFVGSILIAFGIYSLSIEISDLRGWFSFIVGILVLAFSINKPATVELKGKGDGYSSSSSNYTSGGDSGGGE